MIERYQDHQIAKIFSEENRFRTWLKVELAYLAAWLQHNDRREPELLARLHKLEQTIDWQKFAMRVYENERLCRHDVIAFLTTLEEYAKEDARLIHHGLTSSDIVDTAAALLLKEASDVIEQRLQALIGALMRQATKYRGLPMLGRTHGQAAAATTLGIKLLGHVCEFSRGLSRLKGAALDINVGKFSGAVGTYAQSHPTIEEKALRALGLVPETVATQVVARDRHAHFFSILATIGGSMERLAMEIRLLSHGQVGEVFEPFYVGQKGSSAMPHKKNPILSENLTGLSRLLRSYALAALENQALWHERDISHSSVERVIFPDACHALAFGLLRLTNVIDGLVIDTIRIAANLEACDKVASQSVLSALVDSGMMRSEAYELVQQASLNSRDPSGFKSALLSLGIEKYLIDGKLDEILSGDFLIRHEERLFDRVIMLISPS